MFSHSLVTLTKNKILRREKDPWFSRRLSSPTCPYPIPDFSRTLWDPSCSSPSWSDDLYRPDESSHLLRDFPLLLPVPRNSECYTLSKRDHCTTYLSLGPSTGSRLTHQPTRASEYVWSTQEPYLRKRRKDREVTKYTDLTYYKSGEEGARSCTGFRGPSIWSQSTVPVPQQAGKALSIPVDTPVEGTHWSLRLVRPFTKET